GELETVSGVGDEGGQHSEVPARALPVLPREDAWDAAEARGGERAWDVDVRVGAGREAAEDLEDPRRGVGGRARQDDRGVGLLARDRPAGARFQAGPDVAGDVRLGNGPVEPRAQVGGVTGSVGDERRLLRGTASFVPDGDVA